MKNIPNLDYRFEDMMGSIVELCVCSIESRTIAFVCLPGDGPELHRKIADFMSGRRYIVSHYVSSLGRGPVLQFENKSGIAIMAHEDDWLGRSFTEMVMFCRFDELDSETRICMAGCIYSSKPIVFSLISRYYNNSVTIKEICDREEST